MSSPPAFLLDQDVYESTFIALTKSGHPCTKASQLGLATASDERILQEAHARDLILITRDKGFGALVYVGGRPSKGVILLRMVPGEEPGVHASLLAMIDKELAVGRLRTHLYSVESGKYRSRPL